VNHSTDEEPSPAVGLPDPVRTQDAPTLPPPTGSSALEAPTLLPGSEPAFALSPTLPPDAGASSNAASLEAPAMPGYEILGVLGQGGMGVVFKARQVGLNRVVALKMIRSGGHAGPEELARFRLEGEAVARFQHPNIVQVYEVGEQRGLPFFSLEYCSGGSLAQALDGTPQPPREAASIVEVLAHAVHYAHERGIVHRDLKPANILVANGGTVSGEEPDATQHSPLSTHQLKITDFGLAKALDSEMGQTQSGAIMGTPSYMAPEQGGGKGRVGPATDVYALGAILYELLTGRPPFRAATTLDTVLQVIYEEPVRPSLLHPRLSRDLETICLKCLNKDPARRYASAAALADDLRAFLEARPISARPVGRAARLARWCKRNPKLAGVGAVAALLAVIILIGAPLQYARLARMNRELGSTVHSQSIVLAHREWLDGNARRARELLESLPPSSHDDWEWRFINGLLGTQLYELHQERLPSAPQAYSMKFSPDGETLAIGDIGIGTVQFHDLASGRRHELTGLDHESNVGENGTYAAVSFNAPLDVFATADPDGAVRLCDRSGHTIHTLHGHKKRVVAQDLSAVGDRLASASEDGRLKLWDTTTGEQLADVDIEKRAYSVALAGDGRRVAVARDGAPIQVWNLEAKKLLFTLQGPQQARDGNLVAWSPDGSLLVTAHFGDSSIRLWDQATGTELHTLYGHVSGIFGLTFSPDGRYIASVGGTQSVKLWDAASGRELRRYRGHVNLVFSVAFSPDGSRLATADANGNILVWDATCEQESASLQPANLVYALRFSPDGNWLAAGEAGGVRLWNRAGWNHRWIFLNESVMDVAFSPDGKRLATAGSEHRLQVFDLQQPRQPAVFTDHAKLGVTVAWSPDGSWLASMASDGTVEIRDGASTHVVHTIHVDDINKELNHYTARWLHLVFHPLGRYLAVGLPAPDGGRVYLFDTGTGQRIEPAVTVAGRISGLAFSPDGGWIRAASVSGQVIERALNGDRTIIHWFSGQMYSNHAAAISPDGSRFASIDEAATVKLWDFNTSRELLTLRFQRSERGPITFSPDGTKLAAAITGNGAYGELRVWDTEPTTPQQRRDRQARHLPVWHREQAASSYEAGLWEACLFHLSAIERANGMDAAMWKLHLGAQASLGKWHEAAEAEEHVVAACESDAEREAQQPYLAALCLAQGDLAGYRGVLAGYVKELQAEPAWPGKDGLTSLAAFGPDAVSDYGPLLDRMSARTEAAAFRLRAYLLFRAGRNDDAIEAIDRALNDDAISDPFVNYFLHLFAAMAHQRAGDRDQAAALLTKADELMERQQDDVARLSTEADGWYYAAIGVALRREAEDTLTEEK